MQSNNPILKNEEFDRSAYAGERMSVAGTVNKTTLSLLLLFASAAYVWFKSFAGDPVFGLMIGGAIGALVLVFVTMFFQAAAPVTVPLYAILEGLFVGGISAMYQNLFDGIVMQAVLLTIGVMAVMLVLYRTGILKATPAFRKGVIVATLAILVVYVIDILLRLFGMAMPFLHDAGPVGIIISLVIVGVAALNFIIDFDSIEHSVRIGAPKSMEWIGALGLMTTLVWLYLEMLRLLSKFNRD
ncbi:Bax inhibitor-1/YccA family protein [Bhargavaea cecembensis]|uniref:Bax inhibitor-1/YccA family protein n=1 Tax=Bhargavaea cecembensis TaxID=394098 RepID=UPI000B0FB63F|nr:Bax inhibitor-1/YccA family protein [Bhargavaea cecembensis]